VWFPKRSIPSPWIPKGWVRVLKTAKIFKGNYEAILEFLEGLGGGILTKNHLWGRYGYFHVQRNPIFPIQFVTSQTLMKGKTS